MHPLVMSGERMPSRIPSVFFTVRIDGAWRPRQDEVPGHHDPAALARHHLRHGAGRVLSSYSVLDLAAAQDAANTAMARWHSPVAGLEVIGSVQLAVSVQDRELAEEHARRHQNIDLEHEAEMRRLAHLQRVLADPNLRRVWWIDQFPDRFDQLSSLTTALGDLPAPCEREDDGIHGDIRRFIDQLVTATDTPEQRALFLKALTRALHVLGHHDLMTTAAQWQAQSKPGSTPE
ncbi:hypothetical protein CUT44_13795 [Streptomyces carminius]|uniref:Uncharacterized protein n=1 Tax=Streptomyces carminius TaxID=2665496 RepID=A0A2M8LZ41_9ACTN|nr:hypothetical protein CUT44_13795 [Streptomyces carminius]